MRNPRKLHMVADFLVHSPGWSRGIFFAAALGPVVAFGQASPAKVKVKYTYTPGRCAPCPCKCPGSSAPNQHALASATPAAPAHRNKADRPIPPLRLATAASSEPPALVGSLGGSVTLNDRDGQLLADRSGVVVYIDEVPGKVYAPLKKARVLTQANKSFVPGIVAITRGSVVNFPNEDKFFHNIFSLSTGNSFDLGLYRAGESKSVTFEQTGIVDVYCNIHPNMWAQILVLKNPFFTQAEADGHFELGKLPPGSYTVMARALGGEPVSQQVKIEPGKRAEVALAVKMGAKRNYGGTRGGRY